MGGVTNLLALIGDFHIVAAILGANYVLAIVCAVREVMNSRTSQGSIAWLLSLLLLPFPTALLYMIFGWKFFDDYATSKTMNARNGRPLRAKELKLIDQHTSAEFPVLTRVAEVPFLSGNDAKILIDGKDTFASIFAGIDAAKRYLFVQFYTIRNDALGRELADRLIARAQDGISVYVLYDDVGSTGLPKSYRNRLRDGGVKIAGFNQRHKFLRIYGPTRINYRNHRKIVVADGEVAWAGGLNVATDYLGQSKKFGHWRDTHVRVAGPAALACALIFREDWQWATGQTLDADAPKTIATPGEQSVLVMGTGPADKLEECAIAFTDIIAQANERLWIVSPYFVPDTDVRTALYAAVMRGVDVRIMLPEKRDHMAVWLASHAHSHAMTTHGVSIYRYTNGFLHQKVLLVDDTIAGIGSVNFDNRSFAINFEITLWFTHPKMLAEVDAMLVEDFKDCRLVTQDDNNKMPWLWALVTQAAKLLSPIL